MNAKHKFIISAAAGELPHLTFFSQLQSVTSSMQQFREINLRFPALLNTPNFADSKVGPGMLGADRHGEAVVSCILTFNVEAV